jgi:hypothetical protein
LRPKVRLTQPTPPPQASGRASDASIAEQRRQYDLNREDQAPYLAAGTGAVNRLGAGVAAGGEFGAATPFDFQYDQNTDPGYGFRFAEGMKGLERSAAARGGLLSGATLKGVQRYGQDMGSQEYQNAFNRYLPALTPTRASAISSTTV